MNMISTGAFLTEMDASNKQPTVAEKFAAVWEKKNAKAARAGGVSLMALSLAACGSSSDDDAAADPAPVDPTPTVPVTPPVVSAALTTTDGDIVTGGTGNDEFTAVVSATASKTTYDSKDVIIDESTSDADTLTVSAGADATNTPTVNGIETVQFNVTGLTSGGTGLATDFNANLTGIVAGTTVNYDVTNASSIVSGLNITNDNGGTRNISDDFTGISIAATADADLVLDVDGVGNSATPVTVTVTGTADELTIDAAGYVDVTAGATTDLVNVTGANNVTITDAGDAAALIVVSGGDVSVADANQATYANIKADGKVTVTADKLDAVVSPTIDAGKTVSVDLKAATSINVGGAKTITITDDATADALTLVNATVKTEKTTIDLTGADAVATVTLAGDQDAIVNMSAADIDGLTNNVLTLTDNTTAGTTTLKLSTAAGDVDVSKQTIDIVNVAVSNANKTVTVKDGQAVTISADQATTTSTITGPAATSTTATLALTLDDGTKSASHGATAVDLTTFAVSNFGTVTMDASVDKLANGGAETHDITAFATNGADLTITAGENNIALLGALNLGSTETLTVTGSGKVTGDGNEAITAKTIDMSAVSGVVTLLEIESEETSSVTTGSGKDVLELTDSGTEADITISTGAGDDKLTLTDTDTTEGESLTIDMGDGDDTLVLAASQQILPTGTDTLSVSGVENLTYTQHATDMDIISSFFNGKTYSLKDTSSVDGTFTIDILAADTTIDLSGLTVTAANAAKVAGDTFVINTSAAGDDGVTTIKGALVAKNTITANDLDATTIVGGNKADTLTGGNKADTITGGEGADTIKGDAGNDTIILTETTSAVDKVQFLTETTNGKDTIKGFNSAKDTIQLLASDTANADETAGAAPDVGSTNVALTSGAAAYDISGDIATTTNMEDVIIIGTALSANGDLDVGTDGTELLKALSSTTTAATQITTDSASELFLVAFQDDNMYLFHAEAGSSNTAVVASELTLMAVFEDVASGSISAADFGVLL